MVEPRVVVPIMAVQFRSLTPDLSRYVKDRYSTQILPMFGDFRSRKRAFRVAPGVCGETSSREDREEFHCPS